MKGVTDGTTSTEDDGDAGHGDSLPWHHPGMAAGVDAWSSDVVLGDGETVHIRPIEPSDAPALAAFHDAQPADNTYRRYFSPKPHLSDRDLQHFTDVDMVDRVGLVVEDRSALVGWASYERWKGRDDADAAFQVDDAHQGRGIATLLLEHLAAIARVNGITRFTAEVLADNRPMLAVFAKAGWPIERRFESGVVDLDWPLDDTTEFLDSVERREQRADSRAVARLLMPRTIAVIGASDRPGSVGAAAWHNVVRGARGPVYAVNPAHERIGDHDSHPSITAVPDDIHLAVVVVPPAALETTIDECIAARVRGAVVITSIEGTTIDVAPIVARARRHGLRIIGPGSMGVAASRPEVGLHAALVPVRLPPGRIAISMQSGSLGASLLAHADQLGVGLSWFVSLGDRSDISGNDLLQFWSDDETTSVVAMYTETFGNPRKFVRIARRVSRTRPIVAVRTGAAAIGPTGSALYEQAGLIEVPTVAALLDTARVLSTQPLPAGPNVTIVGNSRSPMALATAALDAAGLTSCPSPAALGISSSAADFAAAVRAALNDDETDAILVVHAPPLAADIEAPAAELADVAAGATKPIVAVLLGAPDGALGPGSDVPVFAFPEPAAAVLGRAYAYRRWLESEAASDPAPVADIDRPRAAAIVAAAVAAGQPRLDVADTLTLLGCYGIAVPPTAQVAAAEAVRAADDVGFPVAVKAARRRLGGSVEAGVALDLTDAADVADSVDTMSRALGDDAAEVIVQHMVTPGLNLRVVGTVDDPTGALVAVGLGGRDADLVTGEATRLAPLSALAAAGLVARSRAGPVLDAQGIPPDGVEDVLVRAAQLLADHPAIVHLDLNPVLVSARHVWVTDAIVDVAARAADPAPLRRLDEPTGSLPE